MSTEINQAKPANYIISNTDDIDDVIVRPISQTSIHSLPRTDAKPNGEARQLPPSQVPKPKLTTPDELNRSNTPSGGIKAIPRPDGSIGYTDRPRNEAQTVRSPVPQALPPSKIAQPTSAKKVSPDEGGASKLTKPTVSKFIE